MMSEKFYPLKFSPIFKEKIWGGQKLKGILNKSCDGNLKIGESWELSGVQGDISIVSNGFLAGNTLEEIVEIYMGDLVGEQVYTRFGIEFPLLIKFIDAQDVLSIQVHPDDETAKERHNAYGKTEMWYIVEAEDRSELISGFKENINKQTYLTALQSGNLKELLNYEKASADDVFFMPAGRVHAIGSGILLAEIQQSSDVTYRIYDWGRLGDDGQPRELHTDLAKDVINFEVPESYRTKYELLQNKTVNLVDCKYFKTNVLRFDKDLEKDYNLLDSFVIYMCLEGEFVIEYNQSEKEMVVKGETVLIPNSLKNMKLSALKPSKLLEIYIT